MFTFSPLTKIRSSQVNQNFTDLSTGDADTDANKLSLLRQDVNVDFVVTGLLWSLVSGLNGTMTAGTAYVSNGTYRLRVVLATITSRTFTASKDTYIDIDSAGVVYYTEAANGATSGFALTAGRMRIAKAVTNGSTITSVNQVTADALGTPLYNTSPTLIVAGVFGQYGDYVGPGSWRLAYLDTVYQTTGNLKLNAGGVQVAIKGLYRVTTTFSTQDGDTVGFTISAASKSNSPGNISTPDIDMCGGRNTFTANSNPRGSCTAGTLPLNAGDTVYHHTYSSSSVNYRMKGSSNNLDFTIFEIELVRRLA